MTSFAGQRRISLTGPSGLASPTFRSSAAQHYPEERRSWPAQRVRGCALRQPLRCTVQRPAARRSSTSPSGPSAWLGSCSTMPELHRHTHERRPRRSPSAGPVAQPTKGPSLKDAAAGRRWSCQHLSRQVVRQDAPHGFRHRRRSNAIHVVDQTPPQIVVDSGLNDVRIAVLYGRTTGTITLAAMSSLRHSASVPLAIGEQFKQRSERLAGSFPLQRVGTVTLLDLLKGFHCGDEHGFGIGHGVSPVVSCVHLDCSIHESRSQSRYFLAGFGACQLC